MMKKLASIRGGLLVFLGLRYKQAESLVGVVEPLPPDGLVAPP
jgi:hypothetical protein